MPSVPVPPDYITNGYGYPKQATSCTWPYVVPIGEDPAAHGHWCAFTDLYHTIPYHTIPWYGRVPVGIGWFLSLGRTEYFFLYFSLDIQL